MSETNNQPSLTNTGVEIETVMYCRCADYTELLKQAVSVEVMEQYSLTHTQKTGAYGRTRMRKITNAKADPPVQIELTVKNKLPSADKTTQVMQETNCPVSQEMFDAFSKAASNREYKVRVKYPVESVTLTRNNIPTIYNLPNTYFEIDIYPQENNTFFEWCRIEIELNELFKVTGQTTKKGVTVDLSKLPFQLIEHFTDKPENAKRKSVLYEFFNRDL